MSASNTAMFASFGARGTFGGRTHGASVTSSLTSASSAATAITATAAAAAEEQIDYGDLLRLFTHSHTSSLYKRQASALKQLVRCKKRGYATEDLQPIAEIIRLAAEKMRRSVDSKFIEHTQAKEELHSV